MVVAIYASDARVARAAAQSAVPINEVGFPGEILPQPFSDTGFAMKPLPDQTPVALRPLHPAPSAAAVRKQAARRARAVPRRSSG